MTRRLPVRKIQASLKFLKIAVDNNDQYSDLFIFLKFFRQKLLQGYIFKKCQIL